MFSLVVDNFGVKYVGKQHADHLNQAIKQHYEYSKDWDGKLYCRITITWNYNKRTADLSMLAYIASALHKFNIYHRHNNSMPHTNGISQPTGPNNNLPQHRTVLHHWDPKQLDKFSKLLARSCTTDNWWTAPSL